MSTNPFRIERYELQELLEQSGRAEVWKAFDTQERRYVAVKFLHANLQADPNYANRFQREMQAIAFLRHPNIVQYFDFSVSPPVGAGNITACIVMDFVDGGTLASYIRNTSQQGAFPPPADIARLFIPICAAIEFANQHGIVHGQLKPSNILLDKQNTSHNSMGEPVVTDFGIGKLAGIRTSNTSDWYSTPVYTSPEQLMGSAADVRSDIYSLGIILYEMCAGTPPFPGNNPAAIIMQHLNATPALPSLINPALPAELSTIIMRCIAKDPAARFPSAAALSAALEQVLGQEKGASAPTQAAQMDVTGRTASTVNMPTVMSAERAGGGTGTAPAALTPSLPGISGSSYPSLPTPASTPAGGGLAAAFYRASSPGFVGSSQPFTGPQPGGSNTPQFPPYPAGQSAQFPTLSPPPPGLLSSPPARRRSRRGLWVALIVLLVLVLAGSSLGAYFAFFSKSNAPAPATSLTVGHAYFGSSGLLSANPESNQGITDQLQVKMDNIPPPQAGMSYYAWLVNDKTQQWNPIALGALTINNGTGVVSYVDAQHSNLLASNSRFLITEESAASPPVTPSLTPSAWRYYAEFSQVPDPNNPKHFSLYDHIRHLLSADPNVAETGLSGGLDIWLYRNTQKILEWAGSARDAQATGTNTGFIRRQLTRIMDYLDGTSYTQLAQDLPGQPILVDAKIGKIGLLTFNAEKQTLPGYLYHIGTKHLREIAQLPQASPQQKALATQINQELNVVNGWFETMRTEVLQLFAMSDAQLLGSAGRTLLDSVATLANTTFVGQINSQGQVTPGVVQIHYSIQNLATFEIRGCTASDPCKLL